MMRLFKRRKPGSITAAPSALGHLESTIMQILWTHGESNVREVANRLDRPLAYTTVMTTLDRLFKKGLLGRRKLERAFLYSPNFSRSELLISYLIDAAGEVDHALLDELERKIQSKREELISAKGADARRQPPKNTANALGREPDPATVGRALPRTKGEA